MTGNRKVLALLVGFAVVCCSQAFAAGTITIFNANAPNVGFNDPTPAAPVGGNPGLTVGQQRLNVFNKAAEIWGGIINAPVPIQIYSQFTPLACNSTSAVLGSAGPTSVFRFSGGTGILLDHWYHVALANQFVGADLLTGNANELNNSEISANFNSNLGNTGCLDGVHFYYGFDSNHGNDIDLLTVLLHEFGHGLQFSTVTSGSSGNFLAGFPAVWDHYLLDKTNNRAWDDTAETAANRKASALTVTGLVWTGPLVTSLSTTVLAGVPRVQVTSPIVANYEPAGPATFGAPLSVAGLNGDIGAVVDQSNGTGIACSPLSTANAAAVNGRIALVDRGTCTFLVKVKNAQNAGATGVIIVNNSAAAPITMTGSDSSITIPSAMISQANGNALRSALRTRSRLATSGHGAINLDPTQHLGVDSLGHVLMYAPNPFVSGSSVSHYDVSAYPNLLMEPNINADLTHNVQSPYDLTWELLQDCGWN